MFRSLASRVVAPRLLATARTASTPGMTNSLQTIPRLATTRSFATATTTTTPFPTSTSSTSSTSTSAASSDDWWQPKTEEEKNQADWEAWDQAKMNIYVLGAVVGGVLLVNYWYNREKDHFMHHRHQQEPYAFFIKRDDVVAAGFWPGRSCQFLEFNCYAATYDAAEKMLQEKLGHPHDDKEKEHH